MVMLALHDVSVKIDGTTLLDRVSAQALRGGTLVGLLGANGAGKSTLARAMLGLQRIDAGRVTLDDRDVSAVPRDQLARKIAYLPQGQALHWPLSVERLVALGRLPHLAPMGRASAQDGAAIADAMARCSVYDLAERDATTLSGGERARAMLARALAVEAPVLVADEPLAALDLRHQLEVMDVLRAEAERGVLVIAVLHDLALAARYCDRLLLLKGGQLVGDGAPADVLHSSTLRAVFGVVAAIDWSGRYPTIMITSPS